MTLGELAEFLKAHPTTIYRLLREQRIPAFRVGSEWRFHRDSIEQWINEREAECLSFSSEKAARVRISQPRQSAQKPACEASSCSRR